jgi:ABC-2 type transport system permease protein
MNGVITVMKRELASYFATPIAYVFIAIFLILAGAFTFYIGNFYERGQADLTSFFTFHPWLFLFLVPALSMRLWAEERKSGSIELLMTLPLEPWQAVLGKFLAAWLFTGIAIALTFPIWITVNYLGQPDNGVIFAAYVGSFLMAGGFLAVGSCISATTKNQVIAFILSVVTCFPAAARRLRPRAELLLGLDAAGAARRDRIVELPHPFHEHQQGRNRFARHRVLRAANRRLPLRQHDRPALEEGGLTR